MVRQRFTRLCDESHNPMPKRILYVLSMYNSLLNTVYSSPDSGIDMDILRL